MRLKSLELQGFKSFPDKTVLHFNTGTTAVLGPNGSGKSNISDAVRWVLGELSSKSLRGTKMEDVIFGGSDTRRPMSFAEVTLVLDNTSGTGRLDSDHDEVTVTRRYFRSGTSEYLINRRPVRLRDVSELFLNTGLGKSGYSIIGQGKIAEIISQKSEDRRHIFEEAAGISRYRFQKADAEKKLGEVDENCRNLSGILGELTKRVHQLEKDSEKARIYVSLFEEKKALDIALWIKEVDLLRARYDETQKQYIAAKMGLDNADSEQADLERKESRLLDMLASVKDRIEENQRALQAIRGQNRDAVSEGRVLENDLRHHESSLQKLEIEHAAKVASLADSASRKEALAAEQAKQEALCADDAALQAKAEASLATLSAELSQIQSEALLAEQKRKGEEEAISALSLRISGLEGSHQSDEGRLSELNDQHEALTAEGEALSVRMEQAKRAVSGYDEKMDELRATIAKAEAEAAALRDRVEHVRAAHGRLQAECSAKLQRADALKRMDELFEGYAQSVRFLMNAADKKRISGICGPIARLIQVQPQYILAIETALGASLQNIVVENEDSAKAAIALLKRENAGRCTFYPLTSVRGQSMPLSEGERRRLTGYLGMANELCPCESRYAEVISSMLGRTMVFDDLEHATAASVSTGYRYRMVTLDGQIINAGGSFTGGSARRESGMLTRAAEIERLTAEAKEAQKQLDDEKASCARLSKQAEEILNDTDSDRGQLQLLSTLSQAERTQYEVLRAQSESIKTRIADLAHDRDALLSRKEAYGQTHRRLIEERKAHEATLAALIEAEGALQAKNAAADSALGEIEKQLRAILLRRAESEKALAMTAQSLAFAAATLTSLTEQIARDETRMEELAAAIADTKARIEQNAASSADFDREEEAQLAVSRSLMNEQMGLEQKQNALREAMREQSHARDLLFRDVTRLESNATGMKNELDGLAARIWEEYELTYTVAKELPYPPATEENRMEMQTKREELRVKIKRLGSVNPASIEEYAAEKERYDFLTAQMNDLSASRENLTGIVTGLEKDMKARFLTAIEQIGVAFRQIFRELFGGGSAEIRLSDPEDALNCGIEINAAPPGKIIKSMTLLSGGEQAFCAIALIFAILKINPTPFCIFDEIEAALDEVNVGQFARYMKRYTDTQFIVITHRRGTMESADRIYGISMPERGISKVLGLDMNEIEGKLGVTLN